MFLKLLINLSDLRLFNFIKYIYEKLKTQKIDFFVELYFGTRVKLGY